MHKGRANGHSTLIGLLFTALKHHEKEVQRPARAPTHTRAISKLRREYWKPAQLNGLLRRPEPSSFSSTNPSGPDCTSDQLPVKDFHEPF